jgi:hypothetical protein
VLVKRSILWTFSVLMRLSFTYKLTKPTFIIRQCKLKIIFGDENTTLAKI